MNAMPERVWLIPDPYAMSGDWWADGKTVREDGEVPYVPESRLLAAEARVREVEAALSRVVATEELGLWITDCDDAARYRANHILERDEEDAHDEAFAQARAILAREGT